MQALLENEGVEIKNNQIVDLTKYLWEPKNAFVVFASNNYSIIKFSHCYISTLVVYLYA